MDDQTKTPADQNQPKTPPPVPSGKKENYVEADRVAKEEGDDYWEKFAREIEVEKEIAEMGGVEKIASGEVPIAADVAKEMGVKPTVTIETPIEKATGFSIRGVSLDDNQITSGSTKPVSSGFRWLIEWFIYQLKKAHYVIKKVKGKIWRVPASSTS